MKQLVWRLGIVGALFCLIGVTPSFAQDTPPTTTPTAVSDTSTTIAFSQLGMSEQVLRGPSDSLRVLFATPATWNLSDGAEVNLDLDVLMGRILNANSEQTVRIPYGALIISFNGVTLDTLSLGEDGKLQSTLRIPSSALVSTRSDGRHELRITLNTTNGGCTVSASPSSIIVYPTSTIVLPHELGSPSVDLTQLPRPIYQNSFITDSATLVLPQEPNIADLQAAFSVAAGFGRMTNGNLTLSTITADKLGAAQQESNLIFVGQAADFAILQNADLPAPIRDTKFTATGADEDDGIIQQIISPLNSAKVALVVGGNTDDAIIKAGQAISFGAVRPGTQANLALVSSVETDPIATDVAVQQSFADLGYQLRVMQNDGTTSDYRFEIPRGQTLGADAYIDLVFNGSAQADYDISGLSVTVNGAPIGSARLNEETTTLNTARFTIPASAVREGDNLLSIRSNLTPRVSCVDPSDLDLWLSIWPESTLNLPLIPQAEQAASKIDLNMYPTPFSLNPQLSRVALVVAKDQPASWTAATQLAFDLGNRVKAPLADLAAAFADSVPDTLRQERDLIIVGRASTLPLVSELNDVLPAPFENGSDIAAERGTQVIYRVPDGATVGYLELLTAPWNANRTILAVLGSNDAGLQLAATAITTPGTRTRLIGNLAAITEQQIFTGETRQPATAIPAPTATPEPTPFGAGGTPVATPAVPISGSSQGSLVSLLPYGVAILLMIGVLAFLALRGRKRKA